MSIWSDGGRHRDQQGAAPRPIEAACGNGGQTVPPSGATSRQSRRSRAQSALDSAEMQEDATSCGLLSRGSKNHGNGQCRPCVACHQLEGCARGDQCNFCHHTHDAVKIMETSVYSAQAQLRRSRKSVAGLQLPEELFSSTAGGSSWTTSSSSIPASSPSASSSDVAQQHPLRLPERGLLRGVPREADVVPAEEPCYIAATSLSSQCEVLTITRVSL
mmetsp:Transcript_105879/g.309706  ORF Transcript_105879/g.309706 Transcript_105879/m.309706 type:complete len:217 (-) Transcript_105879:246-896(-)